MTEHFSSALQVKPFWRVNPVRVGPGPGPGLIMVFFVLISLGPIVVTLERLLQESSLENFASA